MGTYNLALTWHQKLNFNFHVILLVMGLGQKFLTWVGSIFGGWGRVRSAIYGLGLNLENFP